MSDRDTERAEAIEAADNALEHLHRASDLLRSARSWGVLDIFAGGFISSLVKRSKMSDAEDELEEARAALRSFARELQDVDCSAHVDLDGIVGGIDVFFDNPFVDLYVQGQIDDARHEVARAIRQVEAVRAQLAR